MKTFNYHSAKDVKEASKLASSSSVFLAGGMTTIPSMKLGLASYKDIINIKEIKKLSGIKVTGKKVIIGATTTHAEVANSKDVKKTISSAIASAENNYQYDIDNLIITEAYVGKSIVLKRFRARAKGRASGIKKPYSNITIVLSEKANNKKELHGTKS